MARRRKRDPLLEKWEREPTAHPEFEEPEILPFDPELEDQREKKLLAEIADEHGGMVDPPPELSPQEKLEREMAELRDEVAGRDRPPVVLPVTEIGKRNRRREQLALVRNRKRAYEQNQRDQEHQKRIRPQAEKLEAGIQEAEARRIALVERQAAALDELDAGLADLREKLGGLVRSLPPEESTEDRLRALELV